MSEEESRIIYVPEEAHRCADWLPAPGHTTVGTIAQCEDCERFLYFDFAEYGREWFPVRWYHFRMRRIIRQRMERP